MRMLMELNDDGFVAVVETVVDDPPHFRDCDGSRCLSLTSVRIRVSIVGLAMANG